jgi:hypothetical protein
MRSTLRAPAARNATRPPPAGDVAGARNTGVACWGRGNTRPSRARVARRSAGLRWMPLAPMRWNGRTGARRSWRSRPSDPAPAVEPSLRCGAMRRDEGRHRSPAREGRRSARPSFPGKPLLCFARRGVAGGGAGWDSCSRRPQRRAHRAPRWSFRARGRCTTRYEVTESARSPSVQDGLRRTTRRRNESRPAPPQARSRPARSVPLYLSEHHLQPATHLRRSGCGEPLNDELRRSGGTSGCVPTCQLVARACRCANARSQRAFASG